MSLSDLATQGNTLRMICDAHLLCLEKSAAGVSTQVNVTVPVLTEFGGRILHGVLTCILSAHRAGMSFNGACGMENLWVHVYQQGATDPLVVSRVYVRDDDGGMSSSSSSSLVPLDGDSQKADYRALQQLIGKLFRDGKSKKALHVGSIYKLLDVDTADSVISLLVDRPVRRTHLLQAYAAMISSPVAVSTMCFNLKRFYDQLDDDHKSTFKTALQHAQHKTRLLCDEVGTQPLFKKVYERPPPSGSGNVPDNPYEGGRTGLGLLSFARNWFTHVPEERWVRMYCYYNNCKIPLEFRLFNSFLFPEWRSGKI